MEIFMKKYFDFEGNGTSYRREIIGGLTTFLSMAYILAVNPSVLSLQGIEGIPDSMKMDMGAVFVATALAAFIGCMIMGLYAKYPIALAPGMGLNAFFAFTVVLTMGIPWQTALTGVLCSGVIFVLLTLTGLREYIINSIPMEMKMAVSAGIGFFITFVGLQSSGIIANDDATLISLGNVHDGGVLLTFAGLVVTVILMTRKVPAAIFIGMIITAVIGIIVGIVPMPNAIVGSVPSVAPTFGAAFEGFMNLDSILNVQFLI